MADYPEWLLPYKTKGVYAKKIKKGYELYRGHSERVPGKKNPVFKCDEYLGTVTESEGLIPPRPSVRPGVGVYRLGFVRLCEGPCAILRKPVESKGLDGKLLYSHALLSLEGKDSAAGYAGSYLSVLWEGLDIERTLTDNELSMIERMKVQMNSKLESAYGADLFRLRELCDNVYAVHVNGRWVVSDMPEELKGLLSGHGLAMTV